jgi:PKD repeat protein
MDLSTSSRAVLALLVICGAVLVMPVLGGTPQEIVSWGNDDFGQVSQTPAGTGYTAVAAGSAHSLALRADGSIASWGMNDYGQVSQTPAGTGYTAVAAGGYHNLALRAPAPVADFTANATSGIAPLTLQFTDASSGGGITGWSWDFGGGGTSTEQNPSHTFTAGGTYTVNLTVTNGGGSASATRTVSVAPRPWIAADFAANVTSGPAPLAIQFTDTSTGGVYYWSWEFGDGATSTERNPIHTFTAAGTYTVSLLVSNFQSTDRHDLTVTVTAGGATPLAILPGGAGVPRDLDGDGLCEDVNGNGRADFADVVLFFNQLSWVAANEPVDHFDYNGNGRIDFADVVALFNRL